ncbi:hypothetical protein K438DRAFT_1756226 [Mycena galopus ATCC 62051]|nr:hypothetical protein K438DRAFT_1756226 [Mycena galopus ATCC 62051]
MRHAACPSLLIVLQCPATGYTVAKPKRNGFGGGGGGVELDKGSGRSAKLFYGKKGKKSKATKAAAAQQAAQQAAQGACAQGAAVGTTVIATGPNAQTTTVSTNGGPANGYSDLPTARHWGATNRQQELPARVASPLWLGGWPGLAQA